MAVWLRAMTLVAAWMSPALADGGVEGRWEGAYDCDGRTGQRFVLTVRPSRTGSLEGLFEFENHLGAGSYSVRGTFNGKLEIRLSPNRWIERPALMSASVLSGRLEPSGTEITGRLSRCREGGFRARRTGDAPADLVLVPVPKVPPEPVLGTPGARFRDADAWRAAVRARLAELVAQGNPEDRAWRWLWQNATMSRPGGVTPKDERALLDEIDLARAGLRVAAYMAMLEEAPADFRAGGLDALFRILRRAHSRNLPDAAILPLFRAAQARATAILEPELAAVAARAGEIGTGIEGLIAARAALAPVEAWREDMEWAFGAFDPAHLLAPIEARIAELEHDPGVASDLGRMILDTAGSPDPVRATEEILVRVMGPVPERSGLARLVEPARALAERLAIDVVDASPGPADPGEPTAAEIADFAFVRGRQGMKDLGAVEARCATGELADAVTALGCLPVLGIMPFMGGQGLRMRLVRVEKQGCIAEAAGRQYVCSFRQEVEVRAAAGGPLAPDILATSPLGPLLRGLNLPVDARFTRKEGAKGYPWAVEWGKLTVMPDAGTRTAP